MKADNGGIPSTESTPSKTEAAIRGNKTPQTTGKRIVSYLRSECPTEYNAKTMSSALGLSEGTVRKTLSLLVKDQRSGVMRSQRGFYHYRTDMEALRRVVRGKPIGLHGIKIEGRSLKEGTRVSFEAASHLKDKDENGKWATYSEEWEGRAISFKLHSCGLIEVWLRSSESPLSFGGFDRFRSWLQGRFPLELVDSWKLVQIDLNVDISELQLLGVKHIRIRDFRGAWFSLYQKNEDILRVEGNLAPKELLLSDAVAILRTLVDSPVSPPSIGAESKDREKREASA